MIKLIKSLENAIYPFAGLVISLFISTGCFEKAALHDYSTGYNPDGSIALNIGSDGEPWWPESWPCFAPLDSKGRPPWHPDKHVYGKCPNPWHCEDHAESAPHGGKPWWSWPQTRHADGQITFHCKNPSTREWFRVADNGFEYADPRSKYNRRRDGEPPQINMNTFLPESYTQKTHWANSFPANRHTGER